MYPWLLAGMAACIAALATLLAVSFKRRLDRQQLYLQSTAAELARFRPIANVEEEVTRRRDAAEREAEQVHERGQQLLRDAQTEAKSLRDSAGDELTAARQRASQIVAEAERRAEGTQTDAEHQLSEARTAAAAIVEEARAQAAGVDELRRQAKALENVIQGYGDAYIIPIHSLLDDLAAELAHTEAGDQLKKARETTRKMVKDGRAADCDYVEANRRDTAICFVVDAFNGKADSILSRVKADNFGTLQQEMRDAAVLVNKNGAAFRNARVIEAYLASRIAELRWAAAAHELRNQEREEQRALKEKIREEEKARKEYERAMKEAEKEEEVIKKAMTRMQEEAAKASEAQREQYELQLRELGAKLAAAEEKNQRALSMAQQTKAGHVYVISNVGSFGEEVFKIGLTRRLEPLDRIRELGDASVPFEFDVHALIRSDDAPALEHALHRHFLASQVNKVNPRKEFFRVSLTMIRQEIEKLGVHASWTMTAAAAQYRESQAIDKAIRATPSALQAWRDKQLVLDAQEALRDEEVAEAS